MSLKNPASFRRSLAAFGLTFGPLALLAASIVEPDTGGNDDKGAEYLAKVAAHSGAVQVSTILYLLGFTALLAGVIGIVHMIRERGVVLAHIAGVLAAVGLVFFVALASTSIYDLSVAEHAARAEGAKAYDAIGDYAAAYVLFIPALAGTFIGLILLGFAAWRSRFAPAWVPAVILLGFILVIAGDTAKVVNAIGNVLLLAGFGFMGVKLFGLTDQEWDRPQTAPPAPETPVPEAIAR
jgi:hypothetical protein